MILPSMAMAAAPRSQAAPTMSTEEAKETTSERLVRASTEAQVRTSPETQTAPTTRKVNKVVSMAVEPDGHISQGETAATPVTIHAKQNNEQAEVEPPKATHSETAATPVTIHAKQSNEQVAVETPKATPKETAAIPVSIHANQQVEGEMQKEKKDKKEEKKVGKAKPHVVMAAEAPVEPGQSTGDEFTQEGVEKEQSWKSAFFFFASLVLVVILAGFIATRLYMSGKSSNEQFASDKVTLKAHEAQSGAAALQQHLNDSSSTSDSGEKIAMLFDRVRKSLEDLGDQAPNDPADVAGSGRGGSTNML